MARRKTAAVSVTLSGISIVLLLIAIPGTATAASSSPCAAWHDDFDGRQLDVARWAVADGQAPGHRFQEHIGYYRPDHVRVGGGNLSMLLTQEMGPVDGSTGVVSKGALISTRTPCGYGTYEWRMRMSSSASSPDNPGVPFPGSVSAGFIYVNSSQTEIDIEFSSLTPGTLYFVNWLNRDPSRDPNETTEETVTTVSPFDSTSEFHSYKFVWQPGKITYFIDGKKSAVHTTNVPTAPAFFMINHWGSDSPNWGGPATVGVPRYFYVARASYRPAADGDDDESDARDGEDRGDRADRNTHESGRDKPHHGDDDRRRRP